MRLVLVLILPILFVGCASEVPETSVLPLGAEGLEAVVIPASPQVGDSFVVRLPEQAKDWSVQLPEGVERSKSDSGDLVLRTFTAGVLVLSFEARSEQIRLDVGSSLSEDDRLDAIEGVVGLPPTIGEQLKQWASKSWVGFVVVFILMIMWLIWHARRSRSGSVHPLSPADRARSAVAELALDLPKNEVEAIAFLSALSDVIRIYLEDALEAPASRSTTPEFLAEALPFLPLASREPLEQLLRASDRAKFARAAMPAYARGVVETAGKIIDVTEPAPESKGSV